MVSGKGPQVKSEETLGGDRRLLGSRAVLSGASPQGRATSPTSSHEGQPGGAHPVPPKSLRAELASLWPQEVNHYKGKNYPIMNLHERTLSVLACRVSGGQEPAQGWGDIPTTSPLLRASLSQGRGAWVTGRAAPSTPSSVAPAHTCLLRHEEGWSGLQMLFLLVSWRSPRGPQPAQPIPATHWQPRPMSEPSLTTLWPWLTSSRDRASLSAPTVPTVRVRSGDWSPVRGHSRAPKSLQGEALHGLTSFPLFTSVPAWAGNAGWLWAPRRGPGGTWAEERAGSALPTPGACAGLWVATAAASPGRAPDPTPSPGGPGVSRQDRNYP